MTTKEDLRYARLFQIALWAIPLLLRKYSFQTDRLPELEEPFLMVANHTTESDMLMAAVAAQKPMYFVCGEHLLRGKYGRLIQRLANPIPLPKGASSVPAIKEILRRLRQGNNVMLFPEGNRSFHGETLPAEPALGKLVKMSGAALVTYHMQGGYFVAPRWAYHFRKGPISGRVMHVYRTAELRTMSAEAVTDAINRDLYENAYATQRKKPRSYSGDGLAEGLENYLLLCPRCGSYDSMLTSGSHFQCERCGLEGVYDEYGFLRGNGLPFDDVHSWGKWIETRFEEDIKKMVAGDLLFTEKDIRLYQIDTESHQSRDCQYGELCIYHDRMEIGDFCFLFSEITNMAMLYFGKSLLFSLGSRYYGMTGPTFHAWKADRLFRLFRADR